MKTLILVGNTMNAKYIAKFFNNYRVHHLTRLNSAYQECDPDKIMKELDQLTYFNIHNLKDAFLINADRVTNRDIAKPEEMIRINSLLPHVLQSVCEKTGMKMIHLSTNCVFSGTNPPYDENAHPDAVDEYGRSRIIGEPRLAITVRTSTIGEGDPTGLLEWSRSNSGNKVAGFARAMWNGITALELCYYLHDIMNSGVLFGIFHLYNQRYSKATIIKAISIVYDINLDIKQISEPQEDKSLKTNWLNNMDNPDLGIGMPLIERLKKQKGWIA